LGLKKDEATSYNHIGNIYTNKGNYPDALKMYFSALKIREAIKDEKGVASTYNNIGNVYMYQENYTEALKMHTASKAIREKIGDKIGMASSYNSIGVICDYEGNYAEALQNYYACLKIKEEIRDKSGIAFTYMNIGVIYDTQNNYPEALKMYFTSLKIEEEIGDKQGVANCLVNLGQVSVKLNKLKDAENYLTKALQLNIETGDKEAIKQTYGGLVALDSTKGNHKAAFEHYKLYVIYSDSLNNEETKKKSLQASMQYEFDKKEIAAKAEQDKLDAINTEEKKKQRIIIYAVAGLLLLVAVFAGFMFNRFRITKRQKLIIEKQKHNVDKAYEMLHEKNKEVMDSIRYAKRIQTALITSEKYMENVFNRLMKNN
jgi:tetratricopeptide (TPR) repeat protein